MSRCPWSDREWEVVHLSSLGLSVESMADQLGVSASTVKTHLRAAGKKVGYEGSRAGLVGIAFREGWIA
jgi:DNA-binding NarL/FixJ family response regulator